MHHYLYAAPDEKYFVRFPGIWEWIYAGRLLLLLSTGLNEKSRLGRLHLQTSPSQ